MNVTGYQQRFILHFGEMGSRWGINRTIGQIYALLIVREEALNADQMTELLGLSRSNVSMGLKELQAWNLVRLQHLPGDRKEYFSAPDDVWAIFRTLAAERYRREVNPTLTMLRDALMDEEVAEEDRYARQRMAEMYELIDLVTSWFNDVQKLERQTLIRLMKLGGGAAKLLEATGRIRSIGGKRAPETTDDSGSDSPRRTGAAADPKT